MHFVAAVAPSADPSTLDTLAQLGPIATGAVALVALIVGVATIVQRGRADRRDAWWKRAEWALDLTLDHDEAKQVVGFRALQYLAKSELAGPDEALMLEAAWAQPLAEEPHQGDTDNSDTGQEGGV